MSIAPALLDTDTLSEVMKGRDARVRDKAQAYLAAHERFQFSILTRYENLRGLKAKGAAHQIAYFEERCRNSRVMPLTDEIVVRAADVSASLRRDETLIATTALVHTLVLVTGNVAHFRRIQGLTVEDWRSA